MSTKHKYIMRIPDGKGGFRYLYTQEEVNAYKTSQGIKQQTTSRNHGDFLGAKQQYEQEKAVKKAIDGAKMRKDINQQTTSRTHGDLWGAKEQYEQEKAVREGIENSNKKSTSEKLKELRKTGEDFIKKLFK